MGTKTNQRNYVYDRKCKYIQMKPLLGMIEENLSELSSDPLTERQKNKICKTKELLSEVMLRLD